MNGSRRSFTLDYRIEEQNDKRFDESKFFDELKAEIAKKIGETGVRSKGNGSGNSSFILITRRQEKGLDRSCRRKAGRK